MQRFNLMATTSYASLDAHWKGHLKHLHDDYLESRQVRHTVPCTLRQLAHGTSHASLHLPAEQRALPAHTIPHKMSMRTDRACRPRRVLCMLTAHR